MNARHIPCGPFQTESERRAVDWLRVRLPEKWTLFSNLFHSTNGRPADEFDLIAIGPTGIFAIEVKHWDIDYVKQNWQIVDSEVQKHERKVRRLAGDLAIGEFRIPNRFLLTLDDPPKQEYTPPKGAQFFWLKDWQGLLDINQPKAFEDWKIDRIKQALLPSKLPPVIRTFGDYTNLEPHGSMSDEFRRAYRGVHRATRDKVILFLYDVSARRHKNALTLAKRECDTLQKLRRLGCVPEIFETFRPSPEYPGEIYSWALFDPDVPGIRALVERRSSIAGWSFAERTKFAVECVRALGQVHQSGILHRNLSPDSIRRREGNMPLFTDFAFARILGEETIATASRWTPCEASRTFVAPELIEVGYLSAATEATDVFSLCASLEILFEGYPDPECQAVRSILRRGLLERRQRPKLSDIFADLERVTVPSPEEEPEPPIPADLWDESTPPRKLNGKRYKIKSRIGQGGMGITFRVAQMDRTGNVEMGNYVAKALTGSEAKDCLSAYERVRHLTSNQHLATLWETSNEATPDRIAALLEWIDGTPLSEIAGYITIYAEERAIADPDQLAIQWIRQMCGALGALHRELLVHGDVTPKNIIIRERDAVLTDYDAVTACGEKSRFVGTPDYTHGTQAAQPQDDLFALSATFFHASFERSPFRYEDSLCRDRGPNWQGIDRSAFPRASRFVERGLSDPFNSIEEALAFIDESVAKPSQIARPLPAPPKATMSLNINKRPATTATDTILQVEKSRDFIKRAISEHWDVRKSLATRDELAEKLAEEDWVQDALDDAGIFDSARRRWLVGNSVDWFSAHYKLGWFGLANEFDQGQVEGKWAYKPKDGTGVPSDEGDRPQPLRLSLGGTGQSRPPKPILSADRSREFIKPAIHRIWNQKQRAVTRDELAEILGQESWVTEVLDDAGIVDAARRRQLIGNSVDFFSAQYKMGRYGLADEFERTRIKGKWAYWPKPR